RAAVLHVLKVGVATGLLAIAPGPFASDEERLADLLLETNRRRVCVECARVFWGRRNHCRTCRNHAYRRQLRERGLTSRGRPPVQHETRSCVACGAEYQPRKANQRYCAP